MSKQQVSESKIDQVVAQQLRRWEYARERWGSVRKSKAQKPTITISRSFGAEGLALARVLRDRLDLPVHDKEIVEKIAAEAEVWAQVVKSVDERVQDAITNWLGALFDDGHLSPTDYMVHLSKVVLTLAHQRSSVIVGRGANFVLHPERTLRVRVIATLERRVERVERRHDIDTNEAQALIAAVDAERTVFVKKHFGSDVAEADVYDLTLNTSTMTLDTCARVVCHAFRDRFGEEVRAPR